MIAQALTVNSTLTSLDLFWNSIGYEGAVAIAEALKVNSTLTSLYLSWNQIGNEGEVAIIEAIRFNPTLSTLSLDSRLHALSFDVDTQHNLNGLLENLIGKDGAQFLAKEFRMRVREILL